MKFLYLVCIASMVAVNIFAQKNSTQKIPVETTEVGTLEPSGRDIKGEIYTFPEHIVAIEYLSQTNKLLVQLRHMNHRSKTYTNKGEVVFFDTDSLILLWRKKVNFRTTNISVKQNNIIKRINDVTYGLNINTGAAYWESYTLLENFHPTDTIGIGLASASSRVSKAKLVEGSFSVGGKPIWIGN